ncbi:MAG: DUF1428 domain-containing protein [Pseudomonadota bacterium]
MAYIDGFMAAVPKANKAEFEKWVAVVHPAIEEFGATAIVDAWEDDVPDGQVTSMRMAVAADPDEKVIFSWIVWPDKKTRDNGWEKMSTDPRMSLKQNPMPFDGKRMIIGGFAPILMTGQS